VPSGLFGGPVPDALTSMCRLLATLHDERGDVAVAGLHRGLAEPAGPANPADPAGPADPGGPAGPADPVDLSDAQLRADAGVLDGVHLIGTGSLTDRLWAAPSITVIALDAPATSAASNTLQPAARAKVSLRVAPGDDADRACEAVKAHLRAHTPWGAHVTVSSSATAAPYTVPTGGRAYLAFRQALEHAWGRPALDIGVGGSIPFVTAYAERHPAAEILITGVEDPDARAHGANESLHLLTFERACLAEAHFLENLIPAFIRAR
jgi:cysteinylglycine-S-conjugate dipeptidase